MCSALPSIRYSGEFVVMPSLAVGDEIAHAIVEKPASNDL